MIVPAMGLPAASFLPMLQSLSSLSTRARAQIVMCLPPQEKIPASRPDECPDKLLKNLARPERLELPAF